MRKILIYISAALVLTALFFFFRPKNNIQHELVLAEKVMNDHPDSALHILEKMKSSALIGENEALYALLMTQAQFKNQQPLTSDSLLSIAFDYYISRKDSLRKAQVYFYKGRVNEELDNKKDALNYYQKASVIAKSTNDYDFLALIYNRWGLLLCTQKLFDDALAIQKKSLEFSIFNKDTVKQIFTLRDIAVACTAIKKYDQALSYQKKALDLAKLINEKKRISEICSNIAYVYKCIGKYDLGLLYVNRSISMSSDPKYIYSRYSLKGHLLFLIQEYDSAKYYFNLGRRNGNLISEASYCLLMNELEYKLGNYKDALGFTGQYIDYLSKIENVGMETTFAELQKKYDYSLMKNENSRLKIAEQHRDQVVLIIGLITIIALTLFIYTNSRRRSLKRVMKEELKKMEDGLVKQHLIYAQEKTIEMQRHQNEFLMQQKEMDVELFRKLEALIQQQEKERDLKEQIFKMDTIVQKINTFNSMKPLQRSRSESQFTLSLEELNDLEVIMNLCYNNFANRLRSEFPKLKDDDIHLCCLLKMKVPNKNILSLLDTNELALKKRRYRIKHDKMELEEDVSSLDEFLSNY